MGGKSGDSKGCILREFEGSFCSLMVYKIL